jgi:hypothetical protein
MIVTENTPLKAAKSITISEEMAARYTNPDQAQRFDAAVRKILAVPRSVILKREEEYKRQSALNPNRRGPKPRKSS